MNKPVRVIRVRPVETRESILPTMPNVEGIENADVLAMRKYMAERYVSADGDGHEYRRVTTAWLYDTDGPKGRKLARYTLPTGRVAWASRTDRLALGTEIQVLDGNDNIVFAETLDAFENLCGRDYRTATMSAPMLSDERAALRTVLAAEGTLDPKHMRAHIAKDAGTAVRAVLRGVPFIIKFAPVDRPSMDCLPVTMPDSRQKLKFVTAGGACIVEVTLERDPDASVDRLVLPVSAAEAMEALDNWITKRKQA